MASCVHLETAVASCPLLTATRTNTHTLNTHTIEHLATVERVAAVLS